MTLTEWLDDVTTRDWQTVESGTLRLALIGIGWWTRDVAIPAIEETDLCETTVLVSSSKEKAESVARANDIQTGITYESFNAGAASDQYDAVYIGTPNAVHLDYAETAATNGKAVLCEKPMEATVDRAAQLVEACDGSVPLMIAYRMQTDPLVRRARELIEAGFLGEIVQIYGNNSQQLLELIPDPEQWRLDPEWTGYGASVMDIGIYPINTTRFLLNRDPTAVVSHLASPSEAFSDVPDERSSFLLRFEDDVDFVCTATQNAHTDSQLKLTGTEGQIELQPAFHGECALRLSRGELTATLEHDTFDEHDEMREEFDYFADRVLGEKPIYPDGEQGLVDMEIIAGIHEAHETGGWVSL